MKLGLVSLFYIFISSNILAQSCNVKGINGTLKDFVNQKNDPKVMAAVERAKSSNASDATISKLNFLIDKNAVYYDEANDVFKYTSEKIKEVALRLPAQEAPSEGYKILHIPATRKAAQVTPSKLEEVRIVMENANKGIKHKDSIIDGNGTIYHEYKLSTNCKLYQNLKNDRRSVSLNDDNVITFKRSKDGTVESVYINGKDKLSANEFFKFAGIRP